MLNIANIEALITNVWLHKGNAEPNNTVVERNIIYF